jgi:cell fate regulator YaaT (PSP1 superfamily)
MAKEQNLSLNPAKISGICGRLMCCLKYEEETYEELNKNLPNVGDLVRTPDGNGDVLAINVLRQLVKVSVKKKENNDLLLNYYAVDEVKILARRAREQQFDEKVSPSELKALEDK